MRTPRWVAALECVILRGIEGQIGDGYLKEVLNGNMDALQDYYEARNMAEAVYMGWKKK